mmetsp:Transcript_27751/g.65199  ORF Transcript_27751/g.65199 Transcript_27751/m.65199 type:complete len:247 (-) Transcript_27751:1160-1900(-)
MALFGTARPRFVNCFPPGVLGEPNRRLVMNPSATRGPRWEFSRAPPSIPGGQSCSLSREKPRPLRSDTRSAAYLKTRAAPNSRARLSTFGRTDAGAMRFAGREGTSRLVRSQIRDRARSLASVPSMMLSGSEESSAPRTKVVVKRSGNRSTVSRMLSEETSGRYAWPQARAISRSLSSSQRQTACFERNSVHSIFADFSSSSLLSSSPAEARSTSPSLATWLGRHSSGKNFDATYKQLFLFPLEDG